MGIGLTAFLVFGLLYVLVPSLFADEAEVRLGGSASLAGVVPFAFALLLAAGPAYAARWPLLFGYVGLLDAALVAIALLRKGRVGLLLAASGATAVMLPIWAGLGLGQGLLWGPSLAAIGLTALLNVPAPAAAPNQEDPSAALKRRLVASAACCFAFVLVIGASASRPGRSWWCCWPARAPPQRTGSASAGAWRGGSRCPSSCRCGSSATRRARRRWCAT
jgi:hypothetical protein